MCRTPFSRAWTMPAFLALFLSLSTVPAYAADCGDNTPAFPTPETLGLATLWPNGFRPGGDPNARIPLDRDTTDYITQTIPSERSGHELWWGVDVARDRLFAYYNAGFAVFDISAPNQETPVKVSQVDGYGGDFLTHPPGGETDGYLTDIAVITNPSNSDQVLVALAGNSPVGVSFWRFTVSNGNIRQLYQKTDQISNQVKLLNFNGTVYAFLAAPEGVAVFDVSKANQQGSPCLQDSNCPTGIELGNVGGGNMEENRFVDVIERSGVVYVVGSEGRINFGTPQPEIWRVPNPASPASINSVRIFQGLDKDTSGVTLFEKGGHYYLAAIEDKVIKIWQVDDCLDTSCSTMDLDLQFSTVASTRNYTANYLTHSVSNGTPFIYYGVETSFLAGGRVEQLLDLTTLGGSNNITEITETGDTYTDGCGNRNVGYWSHMYSRNENGYRGLTPRIGVFNGNYFYRAAVSVVDVHVRGEGAPPVPTFTTTADAGDHWFGDAIGFQAAAANCSGGGTWNWFPSPNATVDSGSPNDSQATATWTCSTTERCNDTQVSMRAIQASCLSADPIVENPAVITLSDPRPDAEIASDPPIAGNIPECTTITFSATKPGVADDPPDGRGPFTYAWTIDDEPAGSGATLTWNVPIVSTDIFSDGFDTGNTSIWSSSVGEVGMAASVVRPAKGLAPLTEMFEIGLTVRNDDGSDVAAPLTVTVEATPVTFGSPALSATGTAVDGVYEITANTNAPSVRWEVADDGGSPTGCEVYPTCVRYAYGAVSGTTLTHAWEMPNDPGMYGVTAWVQDPCTMEEIERSVVVDVTTIGSQDPATVTDFDIPNSFLLNLPAGCSYDSPGKLLTCNTGISITFEVEGEGTQLEISWDGDDTYEQTIPFTTSFTYSFSGSTNGTVVPKIRALRPGTSPSAPLDLNRFIRIN